MLARWLYSTVFYLSIPFLFYRLHQRGKKNPGYLLRKRERFGLYDQPSVANSIWVHTVSVGELIASQPLIERLLHDYPHIPVVVTTMTPTGSDRVKAAFGDRVLHVYLPYDLPDAMARFLNTFNPLVSIIMETELWPNMIHYTSKRGIPVIVANARLSENSAKGYNKVSALTKPMLREISVVAAQAIPDGQRFVDLGLPATSLNVTGTVKFDIEVDDKQQQQATILRERWGTQRPVFIAASTHEGEDAQVLKAFKVIRANLDDALLVIVPRHPERFDEVADLIELKGWNLSRHSTSEPVTPETAVVLGDTMGELLTLLGAADVAFIGGSLEPVGGHNMLEALAVGTPAITGPHVFNFKVVSNLLEDMGVLLTITTPLGLGMAALALLQNEQERMRLAEEGLQVVNENRGAMDRLLTIVKRYLP